MKAILVCPDDVESVTEHFDPAGYDPLDCAGCGRPRGEHVPFVDLQVCHICGEPATCYGRYENINGYACDECCGHGCEDGCCEFLSDPDNGTPNPNIETFIARLQRWDARDSRDRPESPIESSGRCNE